MLPPPDPRWRRVLDEIRCREGNEKMNDYMPRNDYVRYVHTGAARTDLDLRELLAAGVNHVTFQSLQSCGPRDDASPATNSDQCADSRERLMRSLAVRAPADEIVDALDCYLIAREYAAIQRERDEFVRLLSKGSGR